MILSSADFCFSKILSIDADLRWLLIVDALRLETFGVFGALMPDISTDIMEFATSRFSPWLMNFIGAALSGLACLLRENIKKKNVCLTYRLSIHFSSQFLQYSSLRYLVDLNTLHLLKKTLYILNWILR